MDKLTARPFVMDFEPAEQFNHQLGRAKGGRAFRAFSDLTQRHSIGAFVSVYLAAIAGPTRASLTCAT